MSSAGPCRQIGEISSPRNPIAHIQRKTETFGAAAVGTAAVLGVFAYRLSKTSSPVEPSEGPTRQKVLAKRHTHVVVFRTGLLSLAKCFQGVINDMRKAEQALHVNSHGKQLVMPLFVESWTAVEKRLFLIMNRNVLHILDANVSVVA